MRRMIQFAAIGCVASALIMGCRRQPNEPPQQPVEPQADSDAATAATSSDGAGSGGRDGGTAVAANERVEPVEIGDIRNLSQLGDVFFAGQPPMADFEKLRQRGVAAVINLRSEGEMRGMDEQQTVESLGMMYYHVPISGPDALNDETIGRVRQALKDHEGEPTLIHCAAGTRVGAAWAAKRVLDDGVPWEKAAAEAEKIGLPAGAYRDAAKRYVEQQGGP